MDKRLCNCGCGKEVPATNKSGWLWGHKSKAEAASKAAAVDPMAETTEQEEGLTVWMTPKQIERVWAGLPLHLRAIAVLSALNYEDPQEEAAA